jgi:hypothetical protein
MRLCAWTGAARTRRTSRVGHRDDLWCRGNAGWAGPCGDEPVAQRGVTAREVSAAEVLKERVDSPGASPGIPFGRCSAPCEPLVERDVKRIEAIRDERVHGREKASGIVPVDSKGGSLDRAAADATRRVVGWGRSVVLVGRLARYFRVATAAIIGRPAQDRASQQEADHEMSEQRSHR